MFHEIQEVKSSSVDLEINPSSSSKGFWAYIVQNSEGEIRVVDRLGLQEIEDGDTVLGKQYLHFSRPVKNFNLSSRGGYHDETVLYWRGQKLELKLKDLEEWVFRFSDRDFGSVFRLERRFSMDEIRDIMIQENCPPEKRSERAKEIQHSEANVRLVSERDEKFLDESLEEGVVSVWG